MKKIVPFNNVLNFNTDVCEITAISLEHDIKTSADTISGVFYISGEYKITDGQLEKEKFNFELPFDIALGSEYNLDTLVVDIDDFRYELSDRNQMKVNIDLYIDGEVVEHPIEIAEDSKAVNEEDLRMSSDNENESNEDIDIDSSIKDNDEDTDTSKEEKTETEVSMTESVEAPIREKLDLLDDMLENDEEDNVKDTEVKIDNNNVNENNNTNEFNIFNSFNDEEKYVTYRVYRLLDTDNIDKILEKYNVTKEELAKYNNIEDIKPGDKLIIPANDK